MTLIMRLTMHILKLIFYSSILCLFYLVFYWMLRFESRHKNLLMNQNMKYILIWSKPDEMFNCLKKKRIAFIENNCHYKNCFVTRNSDYLKGQNKYFTAILLNGKEIALKNNFTLPNKTVFKHKYNVFAMKESSASHPVCNEQFDNYFNFTWTYKLDSDAIWKYVSVYDNNHKEIGPDNNMQSLEYKADSEETSLNFLLKHKKFTAAWFVSNCNTQSKRENFWYKLKDELEKYNLNVQVVGYCGSRECPRSQEDECLRILEQFYFYFAFEKSLADDYVTDIVLRSLSSNSVPVVYGGADYSRFLPPHSYIDAKLLGAKKTAYTMAHLIRDKREYLEYFKWISHYSYEADTTSVCKLCDLLNRDETKVIKNFRKWWSPHYRNACTELITTTSAVLYPQRK